MLEYHRFFNIWPLGAYLNQFMVKFTDSKDSGPVVLSHLYLILGCALPVWIKGFHRRAILCQMSGFTGIVSIGIGDTLVLYEISLIRR